MDTDNLSIPTYIGIITEAERFNHDQILQFGVLASNCENDYDYLDHTEEMVKEWIETKDMFHILGGFFCETVDEDEF